MTELKRCPFCGGEATLIHDTDCFSNPLIHIRCCGCRTEKTMYVDVKKSIEQNEAKAIEIWNTRPSPWHTDTPTEEGLYVCASANVDMDNKNQIGFAYWDGIAWYSKKIGRIIAWWEQKIEHYKEKEDGNKGRT